MSWNEQDLGRLPVKKGFRMRGMEMTRLETLVDAGIQAGHRHEMQEDRRRP